MDRLCLNKLDTEFIEFDSDEEEFSESDGYEFMEEDEGATATVTRAVTQSLISDASGVKIGVVAPDPYEDEEYELYPDESTKPKPTKRGQPVPSAAKEVKGKPKQQLPEPEIRIKIASVFSLQPKPVKPARSQPQRPPPPQLDKLPHHPITQGRIVGYKIESRPDGDVIVPDPAFNVPKAKTKTKTGRTEQMQKVQTQIPPQPQLEPPKRTERPVALAMRAHGPAEAAVLKAETSDSTPVAATTATIATTPTSSEAESEASVGAGNAPKSKSNFRCPFCPKVFKLRMLVNHHIQTRHGHCHGHGEGALAAGCGAKTPLAEIERRDVPLSVAVAFPSPASSPELQDKPKASTSLRTSHDTKPKTDTSAAEVVEDAEEDRKMPVLEPEVDISSVVADTKPKPPTPEPAPPSTLTNNENDRTNAHDASAQALAEIAYPQPAAELSENGGTRRELRKRSASKPARYLNKCVCCRNQERAQHLHHGPKKPKVVAAATSGPVDVTTPGPRTEKEKQKQPARRKSEPAKPKPRPKGRPESVQRYSLEALAAVIGSGSGEKTRIAVAAAVPVAESVPVLGPGPPMLVLLDANANGVLNDNERKSNVKTNKPRRRWSPSWKPNVRARHWGRRPRPRAKSLPDATTLTLTANETGSGSWKCLQCGRAFEKQQSLAAHTQSHYRATSKKGMQSAGLNSYMYMQANQEAKAEAAEEQQLASTSEA